VVERDEAWRGEHPEAGRHACVPTGQAAIGVRNAVLAALATPTVRGIPIAATTNTATTHQRIVLRTAQRSLEPLTSATYQRSARTSRSR
jgi:hypothetical protein